MEFFINNPVIAFTMFILLGLVVYVSTKLFNEIILNKALIIKHRQMRVSTTVKGIKTRVAGLTVATLVPMSIIVAFVAIGANTTINENKDLLSINSSSDIIAIYEDFNERLGNSNDKFFWRSTDEMTLDVLEGVSGIDGMVGADGSDGLDYLTTTAGSGSG